MQFFWVNQSEFKKEKELGIIRADTRDSDHHARKRIFEVRRGDVIFSFSRNGFQAVLVADEDADENKKSCSVSCVYNVFDSVFDLGATVALIEKDLQEPYSPVDSNGKRNQGYLYRVNEKVASTLLELCGLEIEVAGVEKEIESTGPSRRDVFLSRVVRDTKKSQNVKRVYENSCQVCGVQLVTSSGEYSEGAHIIPLGKPHNGPDEESNILCLCPNHHVLLDGFAFSIADNGELVGLDGRLKTSTQHKLSKESLTWHRMMYDKAKESEF